MRFRGFAFLVIGFTAGMIAIGATGVQSADMCMNGDPRLKRFLCAPKGASHLSMAVKNCLFSSARTPRCEAFTPFGEDHETIVPALKETAERWPEFGESFVGRMSRIGHRSFTAVKQCQLRRRVGIGCKSNVTPERHDQWQRSFAALVDAFPKLDDIIGDHALVVTSLAAICMIDHDVGRNPDCDGFFEPHTPAKFLEIARREVRQFDQRFPDLLAEKLLRRAEHLATCASAIELDRYKSCKEIADQPDLQAEKARFDRFGGFEQYQANYTAARRRSYAWTLEQLARCEERKPIMAYACTDEDRPVRVRAMRAILSEFPEFRPTYAQRLKSLGQVPGDD